MVRGVTKPSIGALSPVSSSICSSNKRGDVVSGPCGVEENDGLERSTLWSCSSSVIGDNGSF